MLFPSRWGNTKCPKKTLFNLYTKTTKCSDFMGHLRSGRSVSSVRIREGRARSNYVYSWGKTFWFLSLWEYGMTPNLSHMASERTNVPSNGFDWLSDTRVFKEGESYMEHGTSGMEQEPLNGTKELFEMGLSQPATWKYVMVNMGAGSKDFAAIFLETCLEKFSSRQDRRGWLQAAA